MNVNVVIGKKPFFNAKRLGVGADPCESCLHRLLHNLADLTSHRETAFAFHHIGLDEQHIPASWGPREPDSDSGALGTLGDLAFAAHLDATKEVLDDFRSNNQFVGLAFGD